MLSRKYLSAVLCNEDQVRMQSKNAVPSSSKLLFIFHRPIMISVMEAVKTLKLRIKDKHSKVLRQMAFDVNQVWNFCNETSSRAIRERRRWLSGYDLQKLTAGYSKCEGVHVGSSTIQQVCEEYATRRKQFKKARLNWRVSNPKSAKYSLGWIPFKLGAAKYKAGQVHFAGQKLSLWDSYGLADYELRAGSLSEDSRGRWYLNVAVKVQTQKSAGTAAVGIDLGQKTAVTCSTGQKLDGRWARAAEDAIAKAQRAGKKDRVRALQAKVRNQRKDAQHKLSTQLAKESAAIFVGNVSSAFGIAGNAKSTLDAGWAQFKTMLEYKCRQADVVFEEIDERWTTQLCHVCESIAGPKGQKELNKRTWVCKHCLSEHDRDVNAALNIRARGLARLEAGISALKGGEEVK